MYYDYNNNHNHNHNHTNNYYYYCYYSVTLITQNPEHIWSPEINTKLILNVVVLHVITFVHNVCVRNIFS